MREEFQLAADTTAIKLLYSNETSVLIFLQTLFNQEASANYSTLTRALEAYHNKDGGSPVVTQLELIDAKFDPLKKFGSFRARFSLHFHYTCSDVHNDAKDTISWDFKVDEQTGTIHFTGEEPWVRDV
ncbi:hypothetical protein DYU05_16245 [Mucilaginibacter terrenus]|uniref:Uncharacterized protein n=1 Tax=Mucilaginibacter terrenus TaxID=2482727 RepID=A0A3E2NMF0_9SPHI|nr:hypothetical protein [Mucilaginibacter terrenus]RFZ82169.1 hypothetical protein DYU05_16245 [Mucilaginibacter terrenus]